MSEPVFVSKDWVEKVDAELKNDAPSQPVAPSPSSRFYDVRPVSIRSDWIQKGDSASPWSADAAFIVNDTVDTSFVFPVFAYGYKPNVSGTGYAVWRGRWEFLGAPNIRARITKGMFLEDLGTPSTVSIPTKIATETSDVVAGPLPASLKTVVTNVSLGWNYSGSSSAIPYVDSVKLEDGVLKVSTKYLFLSVQTGQFYALDMLPGVVDAITDARFTQTSSVVTGYPNIEKTSAVSDFSFI